MSDKRISELTELLSGSIANDDVLPIVDISDTTDAASGTTKKVKVSSLAALLLATPEWVDLDGDIDGVNVVFTLAEQPTHGVIQTSYGRQDQFPEDDYVYDGDVTITYLSPPPEGSTPHKVLLY